MVAVASSARPKGIRLRTSYRSEDQFVSAFHALVDDSSLFVPTDKLLPASTQCYFSVELADESPMLRGLGVVIDSWIGSDNPFKRSGVHVRVTQLTQQTEPIFERLLAAQPVANHAPRTRKAPMTQQQWGNVVEPTAEMEIAFPFDDNEPTASNANAKADAEATVPAKPITRQFVSASVPPANKPIAATMSAAPIAELDEKTTETQRYENQLRMPAPIVLKPEPPSAQMKAVSLPGVTPPKRKSTPAPQAALATATPQPRTATPVPIRKEPSRPSATALPPPPAFPRASAAAIAPESFARGSSPPAMAEATTPDAPRASSDFTPAPVTPPMLADLVAATPAHEAMGWGVAEPLSAAQPKWRVALARVRATVHTTWANTPWLHVAWWRTGEWRKAWWATRRTGGMLAAGIVVGVVFTILLRPARTVEVALPAPAPQHEAVAACPQPPTTTAVAEATPPAAAAATKASKANASKPSARPATKPAAAPAKAVAVAAPKPPAAAPKPAVVAPKPVAVAATKPAPVATKPAAPAKAKPTNVASAKPSTRNPCKASVPCI